MLTAKATKKVKKTTIGLISKKATLHVQHTFFVHFFAVVLDDYNVKLPETSWLHVLWRKCRTCSCSLFFYFRCYKISCCSSNRKCVLCFFYVALALFLVELRWPVALLSLFLRLSLCLFSEFVDRTINLNLIL